VVLPLGFLKDEDLASLKEKFAPDVYFLNSGRASHFMNAEVVVEYFEFVLGDAFEKRRTRLAERYGASFQDEWGLLLADSFTGHHALCQGSDMQRDFAANSFRKSAVFTPLTAGGVRERENQLHKEHHSFTYI